MMLWLLTLKSAGIWKSGTNHLINDTCQEGLSSILHPHRGWHQLFVALELGRITCSVLQHRMTMITFRYEPASAGRCLPVLQKSQATNKNKEMLQKRLVFNNLLLSLLFLEPQICVLNTWCHDDLEVRTYFRM